MKRFLKKAAKAAAWIVGALAVLLLILLAEPKWVLNQKTLVWAVRKFGKAYEPRWSALDFAIKNDDLLTKRILFKASDLCVDERPGILHACFPRLDLDATVRLGLSPVVSVRRVERLVVHSESIALDQTKEPPQKQKPPQEKKSTSGSLSLIPRPLRHMTVGLLDVRIPSAFVKTASGTTTARLQAAFSEHGHAPLTAHAYVVTTGTSPASAQHYRADLSLASDLWRLGRVTHLDLKARLRGDGGLSADVSAHARPPKKGVLRFGARALARAGGKVLRARLSGDYSAARAAATAAVAVEQPQGAVRRAALEDCRFDAPLEKGRPKAADLNCAIVIEPGAFGPARAARRKLKGSLAFHADFKRLRRMKDHFTARLRAEIAPQARWNDFFARFELALAGRTGSIPASLTARHKFALGMTIRRFADLVDYLKSTDFAIPAPVNAFRGPVMLRVETSGDTRGENQRVLYRLSTDLSSPKQAFKTLVDGRVDVRGLFLKRKTIVDRTDVDLKDVALQLPNISLKDLSGTPSPLVDTRIKTGQPSRDAAVDAKRRSLAQSQAPKPSESKVDFDAHVFTSKPVRIVTNLVPQAVPIALDLHAKPDGLSGKIEIQPFDVKVFRQKGRVDHVTLTPTPGSGDMKLDGKIVYKRQDATIDILLVGSTDKPTITFQSDPPMTQQEIMALLLYGKPPGELDTDQQASAGNAQAAFTSGALGLTSLFLFASTPVDSVGYDPATQTYQIRFKLPGGATLGVGSNLQESKTLTLRKRVARNVEVETQLSQTQQQSQRRDAVTTFLQWFRRY